MATIPQMQTWVDGEIVTPQMLNAQVRDAGNFNLQRPGASVIVSAVAWTSPLDGNVYPVFDTVVYDTDGMVNLTDNPSGLVIVTPGMYLVTAKYDVKIANSTGTPRGTVYVDVINQPNLQCCRMQMNADWSGSPTQGTITGVVRLAADDHLRYQMFFANQTGNTGTFGSTQPVTLTALWIAQ